MKRYLLSAALVAAALPVPAMGDAPREAAPGLRAARQEWARQYRELARNMPVERLLDAADAAAATETFDYAELLPAGDLDGDGSGDVADFRAHETYDDATGAYSVTARVEARRGRDGRLLWSRVLPGEYPYAVFTAVGAKGRPGMIAFGFEGVQQDAMVAGTAVGATTATAYDGAGSTVWTFSSETVSAASAVHGSGVGTYVDDMGDLVPGGGTDLLLDTQAGAAVTDPAGLADEFHGTLQVRVLDGATGVVRDLGMPYETDESLTWPGVIPDVTGDRRADVGVVVEQVGQATLHVLASSDGSSQYSMGAIQPGDRYRVYGLGDVNGDGVGDHVASSLSYLDEASEITVVDGKGGTALWSKEGWGAASLGNIDRRRGDEVVVTTMLDGDAGVGFSAAAYDASGRTVWSVKRVAVTSDIENGYMTRVSTSDVGDVHGDGVLDLGYTVVVTPFGAAPRRDEGIVNGRTGRVMRDPVADMYNDSIAFDGRGTDSYTRVLANGVLTVTAWRGDAPKRLWQVAVPAGAKGDRVQDSFGAHLDRDRCGELLVTVAGARTTTVVLSGATGAPMWALTRTGDAAGVVSRPSARSRKTFARTC